MTSRDRRAVLIGGLAVAAGVFGLRVLPWTVRRATTAHESLRERAALLARTREQLAALPELRDSAAVLARALLGAAPHVLSGATSAEAGADLSGRIALVASRAPAKVNRLEPVPDSSTPGRLGRARVHASFETDVRGLVAFMRAIDAGAEVLTFDEIRIEVPDPGAAGRGPEVLRVEVTISGLYLRARETRDGKRET